MKDIGNEGTLHPLEAGGSGHRGIRGMSGGTWPGAEKA